MSERRITAARPTTLKPAPIPKAQEKALARFMLYMTRTASAAFRKEVLEALPRRVVESFEDAEPVNFTAAYIKAAKAVHRKLMRQFNEARIKALISTTLLKADNHNKKALYGAVEKAIGLSTKELTNTEGLRAQIQAYVDETTVWVAQNLDDTLTEYTTRSLRAMSLGQSLDEVMQQYDEMVEQRKNHAKFVARNQIANFNSMATKTRAQNLGIEEAIWRTSKDDAVRSSHADRNGKRFRLDKGCYSAKDGKWLLPGVDYQCRCTYELIVPEE